MQYQKQVWNEVLQMKKNEIINYLIQCSTVSESMLKNISEQKHILMVPGTYNEGNISITSDISTNVQGNKESKLFIMSNGGNIASEALMCKLATTPKQLNASIWNQSKISKNEEISREQLLEFLPRDIIENYNDDTHLI